MCSARGRLHLSGVPRRKGMSQGGDEEPLRYQDQGGDGRQARFEQGTRFCEYLNGRDVWILAFNRLTHFQQVLAVILAVNIKQHPTIVSLPPLTTLGGWLSPGVPTVWHLQCSD